MNRIYNSVQQISLFSILHTAVSCKWHSVPLRPMCTDSTLDSGSKVYRPTQLAVTMPMSAPRTDPMTSQFSCKPKPKQTLIHMSLNQYAISNIDRKLYKFPLITKATCICLQDLSGCTFVVLKLSIGRSKSRPNVMCMWVSSAEETDCKVASVFLSALP